MAASPCIAVCRLDPLTRLCVGCGRSIDEIARWPDLEEDERTRIVERLREARRSAAVGRLR
ncbi:MAG: DUF1289 domain-containing protein [Alphaproteobacteria bacterium]|nr:DUF1289 domain-containing protein [Alphaproteobacteria bacterium]